jgi:tRNA threonylcarbamoyladenosine biosynthesis protein TsaB
LLLLAIDTCGPTGSVALGRLAEGGPEPSAGRDPEILGEIALEGRSYSSTLVTAVGDLLIGAGVGLSGVGAIVVVYGPGSFTGVRLGLSAVKGLAEPLQIPVAVVSRLEVLAANAGVESAALDAHRGEVFLRMGGRVTGINGAGPTELLAGAAELKAIDPAPARVAVCDDAAAQLLASACPTAELIRVAAPTAADALRLAAPQVAAGSFVDLALLDGNYLRRSDAEIFGEATEAKHA